jgi:hypothetical protein
MVAKVRAHRNQVIVLSTFLHNGAATGTTRRPLPTKATMKYRSLLWLSAMLGAAEAYRSRYVPISESDHRELQSDNVKVTGVAYECTEQDFEIPAAAVRDYEPGTIIKICIKPDRPSENRGIVMRSIDQMNFKGDGYGTMTQPVIQGNREKFTTLALCIPGQLVCSFKTKLDERLFWSPDGDTTNITGVALVSLRMAMGECDCRFNCSHVLLTNTFNRFPWST